MPRIAGTVGLAFGLFGAVIASQGPEFTQQYRQRLGGAIDELRRMVQQLDADARTTGQTRDGALDRLARDPDEFARHRAEAARADVDRLARLERQREAFDRGGPAERALTFVRDADPKLAYATYEDFSPAVPTTPSGLVAAAIGFLGGWGVLRAITALFRRLFGRMRVPRPHALDGRTV